MKDPNGLAQDNISDICEYKMEADRNYNDTYEIVPNEQLWDSLPLQ